MTNKKLDYKDMIDCGVPKDVAEAYNFIPSYLQDVEVLPDGRIKCTDAYDTTYYRSVDEFVEMTKQTYAEWRNESEQAAWEDDSDRSCKDCPPEECTGHCMSCYYRTV